DASARTAVRISSELTGHDLGFQVCRQCLCGERKDTVLGTMWGRRELPNHPLRHVQLGKLPPQGEHVGNGLQTFMGLQHFWRPISDLWSEQAEPDLADLGPRGPVLQKFLQIAGPLHHLPGDGAVDRNLLARDVLYHSLVRCRRAADIVLWFQSVDRYDDLELSKRRPSRREGPEFTCDHLDVNSSIKQ